MQTTRNFRKTVVMQSRAGLLPLGGVATIALKIQTHKKENPAEAGFCRLFP